MLIRRAVLPLAALIATAVCDAAPGRTYYVAGSLGNDADDGLSEAHAWKSLDKINATTFAPGDRILFKAGDEFTGRLRPLGSGTEESPIVINQYGQGAMPKIAAVGKYHEALLLENASYWDIGNLELTNTGATREPFRYGVRVRAWDYGTMRNIRLRNLYVHDVNGSLVKKDKGEGHGIVWENGGGKVKSRFDGLLIEGCHLVRTDRNGICGYTPYPSRDQPSRSTRVVIRKNLLEDIGGDGIKVWGCRGAVVEHNTLRGARRRCDDYAAGIWPWACDDTLLQFNEVSGVKGKKDGEAFDSDAFTTNSIYQYNYSHDNDGGFMLICCSDNTGTVVRYNISRNDGERLFHMADGNVNIQIYNNLFYIGKDLDVHMFLWTGHGTVWTHNVDIRNNIFYIAGIGRNSSGQRKKAVDDGTFLSSPGFGGGTDIRFENNILYGNAPDVPEDWKKLVIDPKLAAPGGGGDGFDSLAGYQLRKDSPAIGAGKPIRNNGGRDFWGNPVTDGRNPSIGPDEPGSR